ncbi:hypothetical protein TNCV_1658481 [Trichonephila clavipes]|nr:hypothetical protein TNCV_1658481 [Trichonephila clavipes]
MLTTSDLLEPPLAAHNNAAFEFLGCLVFLMNRQAGTLTDAFNQEKVFFYQHIRIITSANVLHRRIEVRVSLTFDGV